VIDLPSVPSKVDGIAEVRTVAVLLNVTSGSNGVRTVDVHQFPMCSPLTSVAVVM
jgi:hypothetical protein